MPQTEADLIAAANRKAGINNALSLGLLMAGVGAGARGLQGLINLGRRNTTRLPVPQVTSRSITVPIRRDEEEDRWKHAGVFEDYVTTPIGDAFAGRTSGPESWALSLPLALTAGAGGLYGGYKLTDYLLDKRRKSQLQSELDDAKQRYEEALSGKSALAQDLDALYDAFEKQATTQAADNWGRALGGGLAIGIPTALISGLITYDLTKKRTPAEVLRKAKKKRLRELSQRQPPAIYARPQYVSGTTEVPTEDELAGEPLDKTADQRYPSPYDASRGYYASRRREAEKYKAQQAEAQKAKDAARQQRMHSLGWRNIPGQGWKKLTPQEIQAEQAANRPPAQAQHTPQMYGDMTADEFNKQFRVFKQMRDKYRQAGDTRMEQALYQSPEYQRWAAAAKDYMGKQKPPAGQTVQQPPGAPPARPQQPQQPQAATQPQQPQRPVQPQQPAGAAPQGVKALAQPAGGAKPAAGGGFRPRRPPGGGMSGTTPSQPSPTAMMPGATKQSFDAPGFAPPALPVEPKGKPKFSVDGPALGGAAQQSINPVGPGSASNHPMNTAHDQPSQGLLSRQWGA